jgi:hypothetical protein
MATIFNTPTTSNRVKVAVGLLGSGLVYLWYRSRAEARLIKQQQSTPFGRLSAEKRNEINQLLRVHVIIPYHEYTQSVGEAYGELISHEKQADMVATGLDLIERVRHELVETPHAKAMSDMLEAAKGRYSWALVTAGFAATGDGVLIRPDGRPSGRLSHELARDFAEAQEEHQAEQSLAEGGYQASLLPHPHPVQPGHRLDDGENAS